jgi:hypothetical protein
VRPFIGLLDQPWMIDGDDCIHKFVISVKQCLYFVT